eukprot:TRINITY_DN39275_c0_g1_i1.p1 TRINITY_DN39275_c0_g1~~TRINITY_DN39275_c0_g1_i1.p1  ORF type:complete len:594 (-),score=56.69 TRINITY_DN39275_c0_g1_i1:95-1876(-)
MYCRRFGANDLVHQNSYSDLQRLLCLSPEDSQKGVWQDMKNMSDKDLTAVGEQNIHALLQFFRDDAVCTTATLNLMQNSFSRRGWFEPKEDLYKGNGRVRHERLVVQVGTLLTLHVHSYQSHEIKSIDEPAPANGSEPTRTLLWECGVNPDVVPFNGQEYGHGHDEHFDVVIYRNTAVVGGAAVETIPIGQMISKMEADRQGYLGHNEQGREHLLNDWLSGTPDGGLSPLHRQRPTMYLLSRMYKMLALNRESVARESVASMELSDEDAPASSSASGGYPALSGTAMHHADPDMPASHTKLYPLHRPSSTVASPEKGARHRARRTPEEKLQHLKFLLDLSEEVSELRCDEQTNAFLFLGAPGSGKGTQGMLLAQKLNCAHLDFGQTVRTAIRNGSAVGRRIEDSGQYGPGKFLSTELVLAVMRDAAARQRRQGATSVILDGCPRNKEQAEGIGSAGLNVRCAFFLNVKDEDLLLRRVDGRLIHFSSGRTYHPILRPPITKNRDDVTGEELKERRLDETKSNKEAFVQRMEVEFKMHVLPLVEFYKKQRMLIEIDATSTVEAIHQQIVEKLREGPFLPKEEDSYPHDVALETAR